MFRVRNWCFRVSRQRSRRAAAGCGMWLVGAFYYDDYKQKIADFQVLAAPTFLLRARRLHGVSAGRIEIIAELR